MKKWIKIIIVLVLVATATIGSVVFFKSKSNETLALEDFKGTDNGMQNYTKDIKRFARLKAKEDNLDPTTIIHLIYLASNEYPNRLNASSYNLKQIFNDKEVRNGIFNFAFLMADAGAKLGIPNYDPKKSFTTGLNWIDFANLSFDIVNIVVRSKNKQDYVSYLDLMDFAIADLNGDKTQSDRVLFGLSLFVNFAPRLNSNLIDILDLILNLTKQPLTRQEIIRRLEFSTTLVNLTRKS